MTVDVASIDEMFEAFHAANPDVYDELVALARQRLARGFRRGAISQLFEVLRWNRSLRVDDGMFKLNNDYRSRYARLIMRREADLAGFFCTRELRS
jgi:hypothetical protein